MYKQGESTLQKTLYLCLECLLMARALACASSAAQQEVLRKQLEFNEVEDRFITNHSQLAQAYRRFLNFSIPKEEFEEILTEVAINANRTDILELADVCASMVDSGSVDMKQIYEDIKLVEDTSLCVAKEVINLLQSNIMCAQQVLEFSGGVQEKYKEVFEYYSTLCTNNGTPHTKALSSNNLPDAERGSFFLAGIKEVLKHSANIELLEKDLIAYLGSSQMHRTLSRYSEEFRLTAHMLEIGVVLTALEKVYAEYFEKPGQFANLNKKKKHAAAGTFYRRADCIKDALIRSQLQGLSQKQDSTAQQVQALSSAAGMYEHFMAADSPAGISTSSILHEVCETITLYSVKGIKLIVCNVDLDNILSTPMVSVMTQLLNEVLLHNKKNKKALPSTLDAAYADATCFLWKVFSNHHSLISILTRLCMDLNTPELRRNICSIASALALHWESLLGMPLDETALTKEAFVRVMDSRLGKNTFSYEQAYQPCTDGSEKEEDVIGSSKMNCPVAKSWNEYATEDIDVLDTPELKAAVLKITKLVDITGSIIKRILLYIHFNDTYFSVDRSLANKLLAVHAKYEKALLNHILEFSFVSKLRQHEKEADSLLGAFQESLLKKIMGVETILAPAVFPYGMLEEDKEACMLEPKTSEQMQKAVMLLLSKLDGSLTELFPICRNSKGLVKSLRDSIAHLQETQKNEVIGAYTMPHMDNPFHLALSSINLLIEQLKKGDLALCQEVKYKLVSLKRKLDIFDRAIPKTERNSKHSESISKLKKELYMLIQEVNLYVWIERSFKEIIQVRIIEKQEDLYVTISLLMARLKQYKLGLRQHNCHIM
ncbi:hypothetical protein NECID01_1308 [Nematocida sp. AWRm77]|nr:hypothetical protein NECID01_1308 [Nematocida sp. AWRm77]